MATDRLAQSRRPVRGGMTVLWAALVISAAAVGVSGSTVWTAVSAPTTPDQPLAPNQARLETPGAAPSLIWRLSPNVGIIHARHGQQMQASLN
jgi:hypothetical protein